VRFPAKKPGGSSERGGGDSKSRLQRRNLVSGVVRVTQGTGLPRRIPDLQLVDTYFRVRHESPFSDGVPKVADPSRERCLLPQPSGGAQEPRSPGGGCGAS
jgi:hypothetical protein